MSLSSSPNIFTDFMHFPILAMKQDRPELHYEDVDESTISLNNFIKHSDVSKRGSTAILAILFYHLEDMTCVATLNVGLEGYSDQGHWFKNNGIDVRLLHENEHCLEGISCNICISSCIKTFSQRKSGSCLYEQ